MVEDGVANQAIGTPPLDENITFGRALTCPKRLKISLGCEKI
jgi:hypothetical protein